jgi:hypothetical protein
METMENSKAQFQFQNFFRPFHPLCLFKLLFLFCRVVFHLKAVIRLFYRTQSFDLESAFPFKFQFLLFDSFPLLHYLECTERFSFKVLIQLMTLTYHISHLILKRHSQIIHRDMRAQNTSFHLFHPPKLTHILRQRTLHPLRRRHERSRPHQHSQIVVIHGLIYLL